ncbi:hypothetical protein Scep_007769 [Stephania cephalantha]|uniref:Uncharacterized protein n=1 Tax=Stephania cephalantha TaxID=152367 RepID=A0AAP0KD70_9MAGN
MVKFTVSVQGWLIGLVAAIISLTSKVVHNPKFFSLMHKDKQYQKAISFYTEAIKLNGKNATYYGNRAAAYLELGSAYDIEEVVFASVFKEDKYGRVRGYGLGVTPTQLSGALQPERRASQFEVKWSVRLSSWQKNTRNGVFICRNRMSDVSNSQRNVPANQRTPRQHFVLDRLVKWSSRLSSWQKNTRNGVLICRNRMSDVSNSQRNVPANQRTPRQHVCASAPQAIHHASVAVDLPRDARQHRL